MSKPKRERGRPPIHKLPEPIDATPEDIARAVLKVPKKENWRYMQDKKQRDRK